MADSRWRVACFVGVVLMVGEVMSSKELITKMSGGFTSVAGECKTELNVGDHIMQDMNNFWREEYDLVNRDLGCMILCMGKKLGLMDDDQKMHLGNAQDFAKTHGADDDVIKQLVTVLTDCEAKNQAIEDPCSRILEISKCFRTKMHELKWAPSMEVAMEEIMTAV